MQRFPLLALATMLCFVASIACGQLENGQEAAKPMLPEIQALWAPYQDALKAVAAERDQKLKNLDYVYMVNLDRLQNERAAAGDLDGALAAKAELDRLGARQETTAEQIKAMNPALQKLRAACDTALKNYHDEAAKSNAALLRKLLADLEEVQRRITTTGNLQKALQVKTEKERIAAEAAQARPAPVAPEVKVAPVPVPAPGPEPVKVQPVVGSAITKFGNVPIAKATKERPFENSLGMKFVPVPETNVLFCIWETRVKDYAHFARVKKVDDSWQKQQKDRVPAGHGPDHPVCGVSWEEANAFCEWLTKKETGDGKLPKGAEYRLPTDEEWSRAMGLPPEPGATPNKRREGKVKVYPWGDEWPPNGKVGNYKDSAFHEKFPKETEWVEGYTDGFATTAPVGSFPPSEYGLYDMGGNVWEMCRDIYDPDNRANVKHPVRGGSWVEGKELNLRSGRRSEVGAGSRAAHAGFRCVIAVSAP